MAYSEIINEIQEQMDDINALIVSTTDEIAEKMVELEDLEAKLPQYTQQLAGLEQLKQNAQQLIDNQSAVDVNLNINVSGGASTGSTGLKVDHTVS